MSGGTGCLLSSAAHRTCTVGGVKWLYTLMMDAFRLLLVVVSSGGRGAFCGGGVIGVAWAVVLVVVAGGCGSSLGGGERIPSLELDSVSGSRSTGIIVECYADQDYVA